MEARSLNELILLADNPPQYPESPAARVQESLVLYISRVPGTRGRFSLSSQDILLVLP